VIYSQFTQMLSDAVFNSRLSAGLPLIFSPYLERFSSAQSTIAVLLGM
jgi:hypothetical protein